MLTSDDAPSIRTDYLITDLGDFRSRFGDTGPTIYAKSTPVLSAPMQQFVALSPFCIVSSQNAEGATDISPRGDAPGFVEVLEPGLLLLPDRPGNQRFDTFTNVLSNPPVSMLFLIPGVFDTLRVNGHGLVTRDPDLLSRATINGRVPPLGLLIQIEEAFGHCSKAIRRSRLWDIDGQIDRKSAPSLVELMMSHLEVSEADWQAQDQRITADVKNNMY